MFKGHTGNGVHNGAGVHIFRISEGVAWRRQKNFGTIQQDSWKLLRLADSGRVKC